MPISMTNYLITKQPIHPLFKKTSTYNHLSSLLVCSALLMNINHCYADILDNKAIDNVEQRNPFVAKSDLKNKTVDLHTTKHEHKVTPILKLKNYKLKHISAKKVKDIIIKAHGAGFLSSHGTLTVDPMSNTLIVKDSEPTLKHLSQILMTLDQPSQQIAIEARIVNFDDGALEEFGASWQLQAGRGTWRSPSTPNYQTDNKENNAVVNNGTNFSLPSAPSISLNLSGISGFSAIANLDVTLSAYESQAKAEVLSRPRLMTSNQQTSIIEQGTEIPYSEVSDKGSVSTSFKKANLSLEVTPQILANGKIELYLRLTQDKPGETVRTGLGEAVTISTQRIETQVTTISGNTVILGGIYQTSDSKLVEKVPLLGDIPLLGLLFQRNHKKQSKRELVIFLTPTIVEI